MGKMRTKQRGLAVLAALSLAGVTAACSRVTPEEMDTTLASLRQEMQEEMQAGDEAVEQRLGNQIETMEQRLGQLESDLQQMERDFEVAIERLEEGIRFSVPVYFAFDDATVEAQGQEVLDRFGSIAQEYYPEALITVEGFTDPSGNEQYNLDLGQRRASAVAEYLTGNAGLVQDRVRAVSYGEDTRRLVMPGEQGPGTEGWQNRRVVLVIDHNGQAPTMPAISQDGPISES